MTRGGFIKSGCNDLALDGALHLGYFFGALIDQEHHHVNIRVVGRDGMGNVLHHHRLAAFGWSYQQSTLAFTDGGNDVDDASSDIFVALVVLLQAHLHFGEQGRQVLKHDLVLVFLRPATVDFVQLVQCKVAFTIFGCTHLAFDHVAGVQVKAAHLAGADIDVVSRSCVAGVGAAQKTKAIGQYFQHTIGNDLLTGAGTLFDDGEHKLLLAHAACVFNFKLFSLFQDFRYVQCFEFV